MEENRMVKREYSFFFPLKSQIFVPKLGGIEGNEWMICVCVSLKTTQNFVVFKDRTDGYLCSSEYLQSVCDNNVKLIVLDRLNELRISHREIMVE